MLTTDSQRHKSEPVLNKISREYWPITLSDVTRVLFPRNRCENTRASSAMTHAEPEGDPTHPSMFMTTAALPLPQTGDADAITSLIHTQAITKRRKMNELATEVGQTILQDHVRKAGLPSDTTFLPPDVCAVGYSAGLEQAVWGTKQRLPLMVTLGKDAGRETMHDFCVRAHNDSKWKGIRNGWLHVAIEQNISEKNWKSMWVSVCLPVCHTQTHSLRLTCTCLHV